MKFVISLLLVASAATAFADTKTKCQCTPVDRDGVAAGANLWVYWTDASGKRHHDLQGSFDSLGDCRAEAEIRKCELE